MIHNNEWILFSDSYMINRLGQIKTIERRRGPNKKLWKSIILKPGNCNGYRFVCIRVDRTKTNRYVHRLVAETFLPNPLNFPQVNHKNGIKHDNRVENLEWCTPSENGKHSYRCLGRQRPDHHGENHPGCKLTYLQVQDIIHRFKNRITSSKDLAVEFNINRNHVYSIVNGKTWKHLEQLTT